MTQVSTTGSYAKKVDFLSKSATFFRFSIPLIASLRTSEFFSRLELENLFRRSSVRSKDEAKEGRSAVFLAVGRDHANGRISLHPLTQALDIEWDLQSNMHLYDAEERFSRALTFAMGGEPAYNPFWKLARLPVSVHNLGGCTLADTPSQGGTDPNREVFKYPRLFVLDGAAIPIAIGANPSHTIAGGSGT
jgi:cholesterol oxidase